MAPSFDKILKKGKDAASAPTAQNKWEQAIGMILHSLQQLNNIYPDPKTHHIATKHISCKKCRVASFILLVRSKDNPKQLVKFHLHDWKSTNVDKDEYLCSGCK